MYDSNAWSLNLGRWFGVRVRLHMIFLLFAAGALLLSWQQVQPGGNPRIDNVLLLSVGLLLGSVLLHELGHVWTARRMGCEVNQIVLGPMGGMSPVCSMDIPEAEVRIHLAGLTVNLAVCIACVPALILFDGNLWSLLNPLMPGEMTIGSTALVVLKTVFWINWVLVLVNLLPAFPLDGAYALRAVIQSRWPWIDRRRASIIVSHLAQVLSLVLLAVVLLWQFDETKMLMPIRLTLVILAIFLFFNARQRQHAEQQDKPARPRPDFEYSTSLASLEQELEAADLKDSAPLKHWLEQRQETRTQRQHEMEQDEDRRVDEILARVHQQGLESLDSSQRELLQRVSQRYRNRLDK